MSTLDDLVARGRSLLDAEKRAGEAREEEAFRRAAERANEVVCKVLECAPVLQAFSRYEGELGSYPGYVVHRVRVDAPGRAGLMVDANVEKTGDRWHVTEMMVRVIEPKVQRGDPFSDDDPFVVEEVVREVIGSAKSLSERTDLLARGLARAGEIGGRGNEVAAEVYRLNAEARAARSKEERERKKKAQRFDAWIKWLGQVEENTGSGPFIVAAGLGRVLVDIAQSLSDIRDELEKRGL